MRKHKRRIRSIWRHYSRWEILLRLLAAAILIGLFACFLQVSGHYLAGIWTEYASILWWFPPFGLGVSVYLSHYHFACAKGGGIPQVALCLVDHPVSERIRFYYLGWKTIVSKMVLTLLSLGSGATLGYEGPIVQVGAAVQYGLVKSQLRSQTQINAVIASGGAAGVAAAFGTPIAGVMFVIEEFQRRSRFAISGMVVWPIVIAGVTAYAFLGHYRFLGSLPFILSDYSVFVYAWLFGVGGGALGGLVSYWIQNMERYTPAFCITFRTRFPVVTAMLCGVCLSILGYLSHGQTFGMGYHATLYMLQGFSPESDLYGLYKLLALLVSVFSGAVGGIFAPALAVGAGIGASLGEYFADLPYLMAVLLGMAGFFAGMMRTPLTAFIVVIELTGASEWVLPLMITAFVASGVSRWVSKLSLYEGQLKQLLKQW